MQQKCEFIWEGKGSFPQEAVDALPRGSRSWSETAVFARYRACSTSETQQRCGCSCGWEKKEAKGETENKSKKREEKRKEQRGEKARARRRNLKEKKK